MCHWDQVQAYSAFKSGRVPNDNTYLFPELCLVTSTVKYLKKYTATMRVEKVNPISLLAFDSPIDT